MKLVLNNVYYMAVINIKKVFIECAGQTFDQYQYTICIVYWLRVVQFKEETFQL
jgi:hypothetical protein